MPFISATPAKAMTRRRKSLPMILLIFWKRRAYRPVRSGWNLDVFVVQNPALHEELRGIACGAAENHGLQPFCNSAGADAGCHADELSGKNLGQCVWDAG